MVCSAQDSQHGGRWSLWSRESLLSVASHGSTLSIASVGSVASIGSIGSAASIASIGSAGSIGSALSAASHWSVLSFRSNRAVSAHRHVGDSRATAMLAAIAVGALLADQLARRSRRQRAVGRGPDSGPFCQVRSTLAKISQASSDLAPRLSQM